MKISNVAYVGISRPNIFNYMDYRPYNSAKGLLANLPNKLEKSAQKIIKNTFHLFCIFSTLLFEKCFTSALANIDLTLIYPHLFIELRLLYQPNSRLVDAVLSQTGALGQVKSCHASHFFEILLLQGCIVPLTMLPVVPTDLVYCVLPTRLVVFHVVVFDLSQKCAKVKHEKSVK